MQLLICGEDTFRSRKKLAAVRERFSATRDTSGMNSAWFRSGSDSVDRAIEAIFASPFLAERKMVVLEGYLRASAGDQKKLGEALDRKPESSVVVAFESVGAESLEKSALYAALKKEKFSEEFPALSPASAEKFASDEASAASVTLEPKAARTLVVLVGADSWQIHEEIAKLSAYVRGSKRAAITEQDVLALVADGREEEVFALIDACVEDRAKEASRMLERLLDSGASELHVISLLQKHYRAAIAARDMVEHGNADQQTLAKALGMHPYPAGKAIAFARRRDKESLRRAYERLVEMEKAAKSGGTKADVALALFVAAK